MKAKWIRGGAVGVGNWEPLAFRLRTWGQGRSTETRRRYEAEHAEQTVKALAEAGVDLIVTHFYKGYGLRAEAEDVALARTLAGHARKYGVRIGAYVQWRTFVPETLVLEEPQCESWGCIDSMGARVVPYYGSAQSFRSAPCPNNPDFIRYLKHVVSECIATLKPDLIHLDNLTQGGPHQACHCTFCRGRFNDFLRRKYPAEAFEEVFGYARDVQISLPDLRQPIHQVYPQRLYDPVVREMVHFRAAALSEALAEVVAHGKAIDPDVAFDINTGGLKGVNTHMLDAIDSPRLYDMVEAFWAEERAAPAITATGACVSKFRSYKMTRNFDLMQFSYCILADVSPRDRKKWLAESLAFNRNVSLFTCFHDPRPDDQSAEFLLFFRARRSLYTARHPVSDVAVVRVGTSLAPSLGAECAYQMVCEQYLFERGLAFDILFDSQTDRFGGYKAILLAGASSLSADFERALADYVRAGGGLVLLGPVGQMNEHLWTHEANLFERLRRSGARRLEDNCLGLGNGRIVCVESIEFASPYPAAEAHGTIRLPYDAWLLPNNAEELDAAVSRAAAKPVVFAPRCRKGVVFEYYRQGPEYQVHLLDLSDEVGLRAVLAFRPPGEAPVEAVWTTRRGDVACGIAEKAPGEFEVEIDDETFDTYGVLRIRVEPRP